MATGTCPKCGGRGRIDAFAHIESGVCFACGGAGKIEVTDNCAECPPRAVDPQLDAQKA